MVTTVNQDGSTNLSPMGPSFDSESIDRFLLRPFPTSTTYANLCRDRCGVLHITDDVELMALSAIGELDTVPETALTHDRKGRILVNACRWYAFEVASIDTNHSRIHIDCHVTDRGHQRDFLGFCRAKHAVIEAAIIATRLHILAASEVRQEFTRLRTIVHKTAGPSELAAMARLEAYLARHGITTESRS